MKKSYFIEFKADPLYEVTANSPKEAYEKALEWFAEYLPQFRMAEAKGFDPQPEDMKWTPWQEKM